MNLSPIPGIALFQFAAGARDFSCCLFGGSFCNAGRLGGTVINLNRHIRTHLAAKGAAGAVAGLDYLGVVVAGLVKQLAHPDIGPRTLGHAQAATLTPLFVYLDISHKMPKTVLIHLCQRN
jgi:predicted membrane-bound spermidine synthase